MRRSRSSNFLHLGKLFLLLYKLYKQLIQIKKYAMIGVIIAYENESAFTASITEKCYEIRMAPKACKYTKLRMKYYSAVFRLRDVKSRK